jgi:hypothetical protein
MQKPKKESYTAGVNKFSKNVCHLEILGAGMVTLIKFLNKDKQI